jgi:uncharacterized membrane protein
MSVSTSPRAELRDPSTLLPWFRTFVLIFVGLVVVLAGVSTAYYLHSEGDPYYEPYDPLGWTVTLGFFSLGVLLLIVYIVCIVLTCRLTYRMMRNLHQLGSPQVSISPGWAVGWYFIPFANLVMPVRAVTQIWHATFGELNAPREPAGMIGAWWACWLIGNFADSIGSAVMGESNPFADPVMPSAGQLYAGVVIYGVGYLFSVLAALFMLRLFETLVRAQAQMASVHAFK